jgi:hypothetical protein
MRGGALLLTWLQDNFHTIRQYFGDMFVNNVKQMVRGFPEETSTQAEYDRYSKFLDQHRAELGSAVDTVKQGLDKIAANIKWRNRFLGQVEDWLAKEAEKKAEEKMEEVDVDEEERDGDLLGNFEDVGLFCPIDVLGIFCN